MSNKNLKEKTIQGFQWSFIENFGKLGGQFIIGIILARLLSPSDFGLVGMITLFIVLGESLINSGFGQALIQKKDADNIDFSTVFYFNIFASIFIYLIIYICSPFIAKFYNEPQLVLITKVICLSFIINALGLVQTDYFVKNLDFKTPAIVGIISVVISGTVSIILAFKGFGVWALVINTVFRSFIATLLYWKLSYWKPMLKFSINSLNSLFSYGSKILVAGLIESFFGNIYYIIIGRFFSAQNLGYYTRAVSFKELPVNTIISLVQNVTYSVFSSIQNENKTLISGYTKLIRSLIAIVLPLLVIVYITSTPLINIVLGAKWLPVVPFLKVMVLYAWINVVQTFNNQIISIKGRSDYYLYIKIIDKTLVVVSILLTFKYGIMAMIYGHMVATLLTYISGNYYLNKIIDIPAIYQFKNIFPFLISAIFMLFSNFPVSVYVNNEYLFVVLSILFGTSIYVFSLWLLKVAELKIGINWVKHFIANKMMK
jgi:O-antigen/teichoic acid export membrane protein